MTLAHALRISVNPLFRLARLRCLTAPAQQGLLLAVVFLLVASTAHAAGSSMPWEGPLQAILDSIQGPVARIVAVIFSMSADIRSCTEKVSRRRLSVASRRGSAQPTPLM